jgi:hypothetical protein
VIQPDSAPFEDCFAEIPVTVAAIENDAARGVDLRDAGVEFLGFRELLCGEVDEFRIVLCEDTLHGVRVAKLRASQSIVWIQLDCPLEKLPSMLLKRWVLLLDQYAALASQFLTRMDPRTWPGAGLSSNWNDSCTSPERIRLPR